MKTHSHTYTQCKSTISDFSMKLYHVPISQLRQWRHALFWILGPFQGCWTDPGIVWHVYWFSLLCLLENIVQQWTFVISKHSEKCCLTTEQILLDCFGLRIATLLKLSQSSIQEARYFVWMEHKSELDLGAACAPYSEALSSLEIPLPNFASRPQEHGFTDLPVPNSHFHSVASTPVSRTQFKIIISWNIVQFFQTEGHLNYQISLIIKPCRWLTNGYN